jgi:hypothetical protein
VQETVVLAVPVRLTGSVSESVTDPVSVEVDTTGATAFAAVVRPTVMARPATMTLAARTAALLVVRIR